MEHRSALHVADQRLLLQADTIEELAAKIQKGHEFQRVPLSYLKETVAKWNSYVDKGADPEFARGTDAPDAQDRHAAVLRGDGLSRLARFVRRPSDQRAAQVIDMQGEPIPGLYAGGESSGGGNQHGLGRALVHGYIAGPTQTRLSVS